MQTVQNFPQTRKNPVIDILPEQVGIKDMGGTMRLGSKKVLVKGNMLAYDLYGQGEIHERHRHRYEVNPNYIEKLESAGLKFSGTDEEGVRMEIAEIDGNENYISSQFHAEFKSRPLNPSALHLHFIKMAEKYRKNRKSPELKAH
jgi:CTP synthase (UTP-ammonia lyase)